MIIDSGVLEKNNNNETTKTLRLLLIVTIFYITQNSKGYFRDQEFYIIRTSTLDEVVYFFVVRVYENFSLKCETSM